MELGLAGKRVAITGAGRGIGRACALAFAAEGAHVAIVSRTRGDIESTLDALGGNELGHRGCALDLMAESGPAEFVSWLEAFGELDVLVHNLGGTLGLREPLLARDDWRALFRFNLEVAIELNLALIPAMQARRSGRVIFISSLAALEHHGSLGYGVVKAALTAYARSLGRTVAPDGVIVSAVVPGIVATPGGTWDLALQRDPVGVAAYIKERIPRGQFGTAEEVADAVTFLASQRAAAFAGSLVGLDGGQGRSFYGP